ncbi:MAG: PAS domain-containing protein [Chloroflexi bacterium]|nr:PAS domain-containing protein [Chloroflexota bacterium]
MTLARKTGSLPFLSAVNWRRSDPRYHELAEQFGDALLIAAPRTGLFAYVNQKAVELTGYSREAFGKLGLSELFAPHDAQPALEIIRAIEPGASNNLQNVPMLGCNGNLLYVDLRVTGAGPDTEKLVMILVRDAEHRTSAEKATGRRRDALAALDSLVALVMAPKTDALAQALPLAQRVLHAGCLALYRHTVGHPGFTLDTASDWPADFPETIGPTDAGSSGQAFVWHLGERPASALSRGARAAGLAALHLWPLGSDIPTRAILIAGYHYPPALPVFEATSLVSVVARCLNALQASADQTQLQLAASARLSQLEQEVAAVVEESGEGVLRVDVKGRLVAINSTAESLLGFRAAETLNAPLEDVLVSAQPLVTPMLAALRQGQRWGGADADLVRRDGAAVPAFVRAVPLLDADNGLIMGLVLISDRTDLRHFQLKNDHLEHRAWLGDLSAIFAHDVRNPLNGIASGLSWLASKFPPGDPLAEAVTLMQGEVSRVEQLLKSVLLVAKSAQIDHQPVALNELLERALMRWRPRLHRYNVLLEYAADPATPPAMADANQMDQVFTNLIVNALEAMGKTGGTLSIKTRPAVHASRPSRGAFVEVMFGDTGPGIAPDMQQHIFNPFVTTKATGTGLGLAITKQIVTAHKGNITVESWPGVGTIFHMFIPVAK